MEVRAITRGVRMSAKKVHEVTRQIQGMGALEAHAALQAIPRKSAFWVDKTLKSALANAQNNHELAQAQLWIKQAVADQGRTMKRFVPRARGSAGPILKRSCHVKIVLSDEQ